MNPMFRSSREHRRNSWWWNHRQIRCSAFAIYLPLPPSRMRLARFLASIIPWWVQFCKIHWSWVLTFACIPRRNSSVAMPTPWPALSLPSTIHPDNISPHVVACIRIHRMDSPWRDVGECWYCGCCWEVDSIIMMRSRSRIVWWWLWWWLMERSVLGYVSMLFFIVCRFVCLCGGVKRYERSFLWRYVLMFSGDVISIYRSIVLSLSLYIYIYSIWRAAVTVVYVGT